MYEFKMQPSELDNLPFYKFNSCIEFIKMVDKHNQESRESDKVEDYKSDFSKELKKYQNNFKLPKTPKF